MHQASVARWSGSKGKKRREIQGLLGAGVRAKGPKGLGEILRGVEDPRGEGKGVRGRGSRTKAFNRSKDSERKDLRTLMGANARERISWEENAQVKDSVWVYFVTP